MACGECVERVGQQIGQDNRDFSSGWETLDDEQRQMDGHADVETARVGTAGRIGTGPEKLTAMARSGRRETADG